MKKKMIKNLMLVVVMVVLCVAVGMTASAETWGDYKYRILNDGTVEISEYIGDGGEVVIPSEIDGMAVTSIGDYAFHQCHSLKALIISDSVKRIGEFAFASAFCDSLNSIIIPDSVESIGWYAFAYNDSLTDVYLGEGVNTIGEAVFIYCSNLSKIAVSINNANFSNDEEGVLFNKDKTILVAYPCGKTEKKYIIPEKVKIIKKQAFSTNINIEDVVFNTDIENIGYAAFAECYNLRKIVVPGSVKEIGIGAFNFDLGVTEIVIENGVKNIGGFAFEYMPFLETVTIKSMDVNLEPNSLCRNEFKVENLSREEFLYMFGKMISGDNDNPFNDKDIIYSEDDPFLIGTIYCHSGSTAEAYAIENGIDYVLTHFFEGEWLYDAENKYCYRKCIHCDEREISEDIGDVEIEAPVIPDTDFTVDVIEDYVVIEETISNNITTDFEIVKAFDINLKDKDGVHVQPNGTVKVKLPNDWSKEGVYKVYRVNDDGTLTDMKAYREGSHLVFETDHFSVYVIVVEDEAESAPDEPQEETKLSFFERLANLIRAFFDMIKALFGN